MLRIARLSGFAVSRHVAPIHKTPRRSLWLTLIRSGRFGPAFYPPDVVEAWGSGLVPDIYVKAMEGGEAFFIATGDLDGEAVVLGFSTHRVDDDQDGASVYVR